MASSNSTNFYDSLTPANPSDCDFSKPPETGIYQLGCFILVNGFLAPPTVGLAQTVWLRSCLTIASFCHILWGAPARCWPDAFGWNMAGFIINLCQLIYLLYLIYPVRFDEDIELIFANMFETFNIGKQKFRTLVDSHGAVYELDATGKYAAEDSTVTGKQLALLVSGRMRVTLNGRFLHFIFPGQFLDSPEWLAAIKTGRSTAFQVTVIADTNCRYIQWKRSSLDTFLRREPFMRAIFESYIGMDITNKLYLINESIEDPPPQPLQKPSQDQPILEPLSTGSEEVLLHTWERVNSDDDASAPASPTLKEAGSWQSVRSDRSMVDIRASLASGRGADVEGRRTPKPDDYSPNSPPESPQFLLPPGNTGNQFHVSAV